MAGKNVTDMSFKTVYPLLAAKAEKKGRTKDEVDQLICWLTGYSPEKIHQLMEGEETYGAFFQNAPNIHPESEKIQGKICGIQVEDIEDPVTRLIRTLDLMVDQLSKGKSVEKITHPGTCTENDRRIHSGSY